MLMTEFRLLLCFFYGALVILRPNTTQGVRAGVPREGKLVTVTSGVFANPGGYRKDTGGDEDTQGNHNPFAIVMISCLCQSSQIVNIIRPP